MTTQKQLILLSAGGTGGHMTPARSLAQDLLSRGFRVEIITDRRGYGYAQMFEDIPIHVISTGTLGAGLLGKISGIFHLGMGIVQALRLVKKLKPAAVIGFGGYPSVPGVYAAQKLKVPTVLHEQNAILGRANVFLAPKATRIALSLPVVGGLDEGDRIRCVTTGNPVRADIADLYNDPYPTPKDDGTLRILVMGGSLGATVFSEILPTTLSQMSRSYIERLEVIQQCREEDLSRVRKIYDKNGVKATLAPFFEDVAQELARAHLIIARSGASTVAEVTAAGRPALFVPYPYHKDQQQKINADTVADAGGAWMMTEDGFTVDALRARIETFLQNPEILFRAAEKSRSCGRPDAARKLGNLVTALVSGWGD